MFSNFSFPAIADKHAHILILGSMPGVISLEQQQYYAHPRNAFWPIMTTLFDIAEDCSYDQRCEHLIKNNIAVWDVLKSCQRQGSLDQHIKADSMVANDFNTFFQQHPHIQKIVFNGAKAKQVFSHHVLPVLDNTMIQISQQQLPSTSPAHAAMTFEQKLQHWQQALTKS